MRNCIYKLILTLLLTFASNSIANAQRQPWLMGDDIRQMVFVHHDLASGEYWMMDIDGNQISSKYPFMEKVRNESKVAIFKNKSGKFGVIGPDGKELIPPQYDDARIFIGPDINKDAHIALTKKSKTALFDQNGTKIIDFKYSELDESYHKGAILATTADKKALINATNLNTILPIDKYDDIQLINDRYVMASCKGKYGIVSFIDGNVLAPFEFSAANVSEYVPAWSNNETASSTILLDGPDGKYMFHEGKLTFVSNVGDVNVCSNGIAQVQYDGGRYFVDENGEVTRDDDLTRMILLTNEGTRVFESSKGKTPGMKMTDINDRVLLTAANGLTSPEWIDDLKMFRMKKGNKIAFVKPNGKISIPALYTASDNSRRGAIEYTDSRLVVMKNGKTGVIDPNNKVIIPFNYKYILPHLDLNGAIDYYKALANGKWCILSPAGKVIISPKANNIVDYDIKYIETPYTGGKYMIENPKTKSFDIYNDAGKLLGKSEMTEWWARDNDNSITSNNYYENWTPQQCADEFFITYNSYYAKTKK